MKPKQTKRNTRQAELRARWKAVKESATAGEMAEAEAAMATHGLDVSTTGYVLALRLMRQAGLDGIPYLDCKTFQGWKKSGFCVRKGEKTIGHGISWVTVGNRQGDDGEEKGGFCFPKSYALFHSSQVDPIGENPTPEKSESRKPQKVNEKAVLRAAMESAPMAVDSIPTNGKNTPTAILEKLPDYVAKCPEKELVIGNASYRVKHCYETYDLMHRNFAKPGKSLRIPPKRRKQIKTACETPGLFRNVKTIGDACKALA